LSILNRKKLDCAAFRKEASYLTKNVSNFYDCTNLEVDIGRYGNAGQRIINDLTWR